MLVLSRHRDEQTVLSLPDGSVGKITVVSIQGDKVRLGFDFGKEVEIDRHEIYELKRAEAAKWATPEHAA